MYSQLVDSRSSYRILPMQLLLQLPSFLTRVKSLTNARRPASTSELELSDAAAKNLTRVVRAAICSCYRSQLLGDLTKGGRTA